jgi:hypothetical protein
MKTRAFCRMIGQKAASPLLVGSRIVDTNFRPIRPGVDHRYR